MRETARNRVTGTGSPLDAILELPHWVRSPPRTLTPWPPLVRSSPALTPCRYFKGRVPAQSPFWKRTLNAPPGCEVRPPLRKCRIHGWHR
eukprot:2611888-Prymnesium_polylepis.1